jgi:hypothetical protein
LGRNSIFDEPWWLEALAPGAWDAVEVEQDGKLVARLPYVRRRRRGLTVLTQPGLTQSLGPWLAPHEGRYTKRLELEKARMNALIERLPPFHVFQQSFSTDITNWLPFHWAGFSATVRYTYRIEDLSDPERIWSEMADKVRSAIRKAEKQVEVRDDLTFDEFVPLNDETFAQKGMANPAGREALRRLDAAASARGARQILAAVDADGAVRAATYVVHDERTAYYLLAGRGPGKLGGEPSLLIWHAIQRARDTSQAFDFEGSMIESIERFFRSFGARQTPYLRVTGVRGRGRIAELARSVRAWR